MEYYDYPDTAGLSYRDRKILLLKHQQEMLKETSPTDDLLRFQQRVLRERLLAPSPKSKEEKIKHIQKAQYILKDLERQERKKLEQEKKLKEKLAKAEEKIKGRIIKTEGNKYGMGRHPFY